MGSPQSPILADFFMHMIESLSTDHISWLSYYRCYVNDKLIFCPSRQTIEDFVYHLNSCHSNLKVTIEYEVDERLPFLDILIIQRSDGSIKRMVYRKSTRSGQYLNFSSFTPIKHKCALVQISGRFWQRLLLVCSGARHVRVCT